MSSSDQPSADPEPGARRGLKLWQLLVIGAFALVLIVVGVVTYPRSSSSSNDSGPVKVGDAVPHFSTEALAGSNKVGIPETTGSTGHPVVVMFFASWCKPCQEEMPSVSAAINSGTGTVGKATIIAVDALDQRSSALAFKAKNDMQMPIGFDPNGSVTNGTFGFAGLPYTVFADAKGTITEVHPGGLSVTDLRQGIAQAQKS